MTLFFLVLVVIMKVSLCLAEGGYCLLIFVFFSRILTHRKIKYTDQSRKLATAKREFQLKFGTQHPDRKRLTMMDLIFYNPTTNPMSEK